LLVSVQFPIADLRRFVTVPTGQLPLPTWPSPLPSLEFVRGFGPISRRPRAISQDYLGEHRVCEARRALRFVPVERPEFECAYRRFFFDGKLVGKFDIGLRRKPIAMSLDTPPTKLGEILQRALELNFCVPGLAGGEKPRPLHALSGLLAKTYLRASTAHNASTLTAWAVGGSPMVVIEYGPRDRLLLPSHAQAVPCTLEPSIKLHHFWFEPKAGTQLSSWLLYSESGPTESSIRHLRICLAQLHATRACLELVLHSIAAEKIAPANASEAKQALQGYFDATRRQLARIRARSKEFGAGFTAAAAEAFEEINPFTEQLLETLEKALKRLGLKYSTVKGALQEVGRGDPHHRTVSIPSGLEQLGQPIALSSPRPAKPEGPLPQADILIVTALKDERDAVLAYQEGLHEQWHPIRGPKGLNYHVATFEPLYESPRKLRVVVAQPLQMGGLHTVSLVTRLMELSPSMLAMSGICAGDRRYTKPGDIIIAERVFKVEQGKLKALKGIDGQRREDIYHDLTTYNLKPRLLAAAQELQGTWQRQLPSPKPLSYISQEQWLLLMLAKNDAKALLDSPERRVRCPDWQEVLQRLRQRQLLEPEGLTITSAGMSWVETLMIESPDGVPEEPRLPRVHISPLATTSYVQQDPELFPNLERLVRKTLGVEMEGAAIGAVAHLEEVPMLIVKAVADHGDHDKDDRFRRYAAEASAWFLLDFVRKYWTNIAPGSEVSTTS
jgi:nucleoside phosphorylase